jgi:hypothetical protein
MKSEFIASLVAMVAATAPGGEASNPSGEYRCPVDDTQTMKVFRGMEGDLLATLCAPSGHLDESAGAAFQEGLLRLAADTRFGDLRVGLLEPDGGSGIGLALPPALMADADRLDRALDGVRETLARLGGPSGAGRTALVARDTFEEAAWIKV